MMASGEDAPSHDGLTFRQIVVDGIGRPQTAHRQKRTRSRGSGKGGSRNKRSWSAYAEPSGHVQCRSHGV